MSGENSSEKDLLCCVSQRFAIVSHSFRIGFAVVSQFAICETFAKRLRNAPKRSKASPFHWNSPRSCFVMRFS